MSDIHYPIKKILAAVLLLHSIKALVKIKQMIKGKGIPVKHLFVLKLSKPYISSTPIRSFELRSCPIELLILFTSLESRNINVNNLFLLWK